MYQVVELFVPLGAFAMCFGIAYVYFTTENRKKLAMIEAGLDPREEKKAPEGNENLKKGLLLFFVPIGYLVGRMLEFIGGSANMRGILCAILFGGLAFLLFHFLNRGSKDKNATEE